MVVAVGESDFCLTVVAVAAERLHLNFVVAAAAVAVVVRDNAVSAH